MSAGKLATIVAIDVAGYSALAEANEAAAVAAVARLAQRCARVAKAHGGRICNTAGDSVMMEFPNVSAALEAADELARNPDPPIRVGVHLGEVRSMPNGDLLGHGVNVATRLQALAPAGGVIVSEDAKRPLRDGPMAERLVSRGVVKLDKIDETITIYELSQDAAAVARTELAQRAKRAARRTAIVSVAALAAAGVAALAWPLLQPPRAARVAVLSLTAPADDSALQQLVQGVGDDITLALSASDVQTLAAAETAEGSRNARIEHADRLGAALAVDGSAERAGARVRLTIGVTRTSDRTTLWSDVFEGPATDANAVRLQAAARSADVLACGVDVVRQRRANMESETFSLLLRACALQRSSDQIETRDAFAAVVERAPRLTYARAMLALASANASQSAAERLRESLRESARVEAERAQRENRNIGESYLALQTIETRTNWGARERLIQEALERDELNGTVNTYQSNLLTEMGRISEALVFARRASTLDPLSSTRQRNYALVLLLNGQADEARAIVENQAANWPNEPGVWGARIRTALWGLRYNEAIALIDAPASAARTPRARSCWRQAIEALGAGVANVQAAQRVRACSANGDLPPDQAMMMLARLGDLDGAFALAQRLYLTECCGTPGALFAPAAAPMRADARFMPLMRDMGLLQHWRLSDRWPDFCRAPGLPYRCDAEARRLT